jgi:dextranase
MKKIIYLVAAFLCMACSDDHESNQENGGASGGVTEVTPVTSDLSVDLSTDKAFYKPGEKVVFTAEDALPAGTKVRYRLLGEVVGEESVNGTSWTWQPPTTDFKGYMAELYRQENGTDVILGTIAVDVSSDPSRFPRYGFVADFSREKTAEKTQEEMAYLNRHHINWVQFQDWHNKHHWPLGGTRTQLDEVYMDIANREVYTSSVKNYIEAQHRFGMKSMFYNLCFGALKDAATDGVKEEWYLFKDASHTTKDSHDLPGGWKSNIYLVDPSNKE